MKINLTTKLLILACLLCIWSGIGHAQQISGQDVLPNTNSTDSTAVLNNTLRLNQNAINAIGGYFSSNGALGVVNGGTGAVTLTGILLGNGQSPITGIALPLDANQFLNGNGAFSAFGHSVQLFTSSGTFTASAGVTTIYITAIGAGAGGAGANSTSASTACGGGGGSGAYLINYPYTVVAGNSYTITLNNGGAGGIGAANGSNGGTTVIDTLTLLGGSGGVNGGTGTCNGGAGGLGQNISSNIVTTINSAATNFGNSGWPGARGDTAGQFGGNAGSSPFGQTLGQSGRNATGKAAPTNSGAGGGGSWDGASTDRTGGAGAKGFVFIQY